ncbi:MAG: zinc ribbon domain-containing protein [Kofleriaceae bacterium]
MAEERVESQGFFEMLWDCEHCETKGLLAKSQRHCAECGGKQNPDKRYFPKEGDALQRVDGHKYEGSDRQCPHCGAPQSAKANNCTHCGAPQDGASEVRGVVGAPAPPPAKRKWWPPVAVILVVIGLIFGVWYSCIRTRSAQVKVTGHSWACSIGIDRFGDVSGEAWSEQVPRDARDVRCHPKQKSSRQIPDGETCSDERVDRKDGTFEVVRKCRPKYRSEPVEGEWCAFTRRDWKQVDQRSTSGTGTAIACPADNLPPAQAVDQVGATRQGAKKETRTLQLGNQACEVSDSKWRSLADGAAVKVEVRARSGEIVCSSL